MPFGEIRGRGGGLLGRDLSAVVFDLDGTVADTIDLIVYALNHALADVWPAWQTLEEIRARFGPPDDELIRRELRGRGDFEAVLRRYYDVYQSAHPEFARLFPGMAEVLGALKEAGLGLGLLTNKARRAAEITLEELGIGHFFSVVVSGNDAPPKPDPTGLLQVLRKLGADPESSAMVGDGPSDVAVARRAGVLAVRVLWGRTHAADAPGEKADWLVTSPEELLALLVPRARGKT